MNTGEIYKVSKQSQGNVYISPPYCREFENIQLHAKIKPLEVSDPGRILVLTESLYEKETQALEKKLNYYVQSETYADCVFIISLVSLSEEAVIQVIGQEMLEKGYRMPIKHQIFMQAVKKKKMICKNFKEFDSGLQQLLGLFIKMGDRSKPNEIVVVPIFPKGETSQSSPLPLLVCVVNSPKSKDFTAKIVTEVYRFSLPIIINTSKLEEETRIKKQCQSLLHVARGLFSHLADLNDLLKQIMYEAKRLTASERCALFLLDPDQVNLVAKVFDRATPEDLDTEVKIAKDQGIAGHVAATGKILNIRDAYNHPLFFKGIDEATGFRTRNILCFPIRDEEGIVGVAQLCNKAWGDFDYFDEEIALAFSIYCGLSITHSLLYKKLQEAQNRSKLSNELMLYHMKVSDRDVSKILLCTNRHAYLDYDRFHFSPRRIRPSETECHILRMFEDLKFPERFRIKRNLLARFVLYVKKGYRDPPYHNWMHGFSAAHFAYCAMKQLKLLEKRLISKLEGLALITACMCHDLDHRGTTNSFQLQSGSLLANLYSSEGSVMEHHHLSQTLCILNTEDCNFLECLGHDEYVIFLALLRDMILATDLGNHFELMPRQKKVVEEGYDSGKSEHKYVFLCLVMTCADLSDQIKDWGVVKVVASQIYNEFFQQGDMEKSMGKTPLAMMDRDRASIPDLQIDFLMEICLPVFTTLSELFPEAVILARRIKRNKRCWEACKVMYRELCKDSGETSLEILNSSDIDDAVKMILDQSDDDMMSSAMSESVHKDEMDRRQSVSSAGSANSQHTTSTTSSKISEASSVSRSNKVDKRTSKASRASKGFTTTKTSKVSKDGKGDQKSTSIVKK